MHTIREVAPDVFEFIIRTPEEASRQTYFGSRYAAWFLRDGETTALIEPGPTLAAQECVVAIQELGYDPDALEYIIPTHIHVDHGGGIGWCARELARPQIVVHPRGRRHALDPTRLITATAAVFGERWEEQYGPILPVPEDRLLTRDEGEAIRLAGRDHQVYYTPGHAPHHFALFDPERGFLYSGEAAGQPLFSDGVGPPSSPPSFDIEAAIASIEKLEGLGASRLFYSHQGVSDADPQRALEAAKSITAGIARTVREALGGGVADHEVASRVEAYYRERFGAQGPQPDFGNVVMPFVNSVKQELAQGKGTA